MPGKQKDPEIRYGVFRRNQFISPFGTGSIMDLQGESGMAAAIDKWPEAGPPKIYEPRLQKRLGVTHFKMVPSYLEHNKGIPFYRFPKWLYCRNPRCSSLKHVIEWRKDNIDKNRLTKKPLCDTCRIPLNPSRFIIVCKNGHIDDFPWIEWAHKNKDSVCQNPDLKLRMGSSDSSLAGIKVECKTCGASNNLKRAFEEGAHDCTGNKPWIDSKEECNKKAITVQRTASNVYFPKTVSSIEIPPYIDNLMSDIMRTDAWNLWVSQTGLAIEENTIHDAIARQLNVNIERVTRAIRRFQSVSDDIKSKSEVEYRYEEYMALKGYYDTEGDDELSKDFRLETLDKSNYDIPGLDMVGLVHRLREVRALVAFSRIQPLDRNDINADVDNIDNEIKAVSVKENKNIKWLPGTEVRGEGIFISFDKEELEKWVNNNEKVKKRADEINNRLNNLLEQRGMESRNTPSKFLFLHTLAHLLIRQLSFECGYATASLRERIYCDESDTQETMSAILIYTASGDSEGTMGGLVRQGKPEFLNSIVKKAIRSASWCSTDPLCIESNGQGMNSLNMAACHACALLPETSCEEFNRLLDRAFVIGLPEDKDMGFMSSLLLNKVIRENKTTK